MSNEAIQPGKLADESQIGGLSSLFTPQKTTDDDDEEDDIDIDNDNSNKIINIVERNFPKPPKKRYTELPIDNEQKRDCKIDLFGEQTIENTESNNNNEQHHLVN